jgi:hypothetical protein
VTLPKTKANAKPEKPYSKTEAHYARSSYSFEMRDKMDPINLGFYAVICGTLNVAGPFMGGIVSRFGIGAVVGLAAAWALPMLRGAVGY